MSSACAATAADVAASKAAFFAAFASRLSAHSSLIAVRVALSVPVGAARCRSLPLLRAWVGVAYGARTRNLRSHNPMLCH